MSIAPTPNAAGPDEDGLKIMLSRLEDDRRLIAAGKLQRWEIFKWTVGVNIALAGVSALPQLPKNAMFALLLVALTVTGSGISLLLYQHVRMGRTRAEGDDLAHELEVLTGVRARLARYDWPPTPKGIGRDWLDVAILLGMMVLSFLLLLIVWFYKPPNPPKSEPRPAVLTLLTQEPPISRGHYGARRPTSLRGETCA